VTKSSQFGTIVFVWQEIDCVAVIGHYRTHIKVTLVELFLKFVMNILSYY